MVTVKQEGCIGCGACHEIEPNVFIINEDGLAEAVNEAITEENKEKVIEAINSCPTEVIVES